MNENEGFHSNQGFGKENRHVESSDGVEIRLCLCVIDR